MGTEASTTCGLGVWRPEWIQRFARKEMYALVYSFIGIIQGMGFSYLTAVLSTIEKQFGIKSKETAWVFSGNEIRWCPNWYQMITLQNIIQPNLIHFCSTLPRPHKEADSLDFAIHDVDCFWIVPLRPSLLHPRQT